MLIGRRLRELRESKNLSQGDIEQRTGLLRCYISRVENGHTVPSVETLQKWARGLEVPFHLLFHDGESPIEKPTLGLGKDGNDERVLWGSRGHERGELLLFVEQLARLTDRQRNLLMAAARFMVE